MPDHRIVVLTPSFVAKHWPTIRELLAPAMEFSNGEMEVDDIRTMVFADQAFLMGVLVAGKPLWVAACECLRYPRRTVLHVLAVGGQNLHEALTELWADIAFIAHTLGATAVRGAVRPSMERYSRRYAPKAKKVYVVMEQVL
jgi:hypothetical protein